MLRHALLTNSNQQPARDVVNECCVGMLSEEDISLSQSSSSFQVSIVDQMYHTEYQHNGTKYLRKRRPACNVNKRMLGRTHSLPTRAHNRSTCLSEYRFISPTTVVIMAQYIKLNDECISAYKRVNSLKGPRYCVFLLKSETELILSDVGDRDSTWDGFVDSLPEKATCYILYQLPYVSQSDNVERTKLLFIMWYVMFQRTWHRSNDKCGTGPPKKPPGRRK